MGMVTCVYLIGMVTCVYLMTMVTCVYLCGVACLLGTVGITEVDLNLVAGYLPVLLLGRGRQPRHAQLLVLEVPLQVAG